MKNAVSALALGAFASAAALAATPAAAEELSVSTSVAFESAYVFRGQQLAETAIQPSVELGYGGFYGGAWFSMPIGDDDVAFGDELDLYAGYGGALSELVSYDVGVTYYTYPDAMSGLFDVQTNTVEIFGGLALDAVLSPALYVYYDFHLDTTTIEGSAGYSFPLSESTSFDLGGAIGYALVKGATNVLYGTATADLSYALSDDASASIGVRYGGSDVAGGSLIDDSIAGTTKSSGFWWGLSVGSSF